MEHMRLFNRDLSWIEFNARVLSEAQRKDVPLLERVRFLSITYSNFDEFFQVRVAAIKRDLKNNIFNKDVSGLAPSILLSQISARCHQISRVQCRCLEEEVMPKLAENGLPYIKPKDFTREQKEFAQNYFRSAIFPLLTPIRMEEGFFPLIDNLKCYAAFLIRPMSNMQPLARATYSEAEPVIALVKMPHGIRHILWLPSIAHENPFTLAEDLLLYCGSQLFPGYSVEETMLFSVTRDADLSVEEDSGADFIGAMEDILAKRRSSFAVRLVCGSSSSAILDVLAKNLELAFDDVYIMQYPLNPALLLELEQLECVKKFLYPDWQHFYQMPDESYWNILKRHDILLNVPYESYQPVIKFISDAASDPDVLAIKMTLYRTDSDSPVIAALERAANSDKQVTCLVELKARFDEEHNIEWASRLERAGVTVIYGIENYKVHAKILIIMRRENGTIQRYVHMSTGNYNSKTAKLYSDLSIFTSDPQIASDATQFFNIVSGYSTIQTMKSLSMSPVNLKERILTMIQREIDLSTKSKPGLIIAKMNSLSHAEVIEALYKASNAGVKVMLNVRGICMLTPGVAGMSENITVVSIVDRYLEHSRIFYFQNGDLPEMFLSSADWMVRNLDRRIELMFPVTDRKIFKELLDTLLLYFKDNTHAHILNSDGSWKHVAAKDNEHEVRAQETLYLKFKHRTERAEHRHEIRFKVRRKD